MVSNVPPSRLYNASHLPGLESIQCLAESCVFVKGRTDRRVPTTLRAGRKKATAVQYNAQSGGGAQLNRSWNQSQVHKRTMEEMVFSRPDAR